MGPAGNGSGTKDLKCFKTLTARIPEREIGMALHMLVDMTID